MTWLLVVALIEAEFLSWIWRMHGAAATSARKVRAHRVMHRMARSGQRFRARRYKGSTTVRENEGGPFFARWPRGAKHSCKGQREFADLKRIEPTHL